MTVCALPISLPAGSAAWLEAFAGSLCTEATSAFEQQLADALNQEAESASAGGSEGFLPAALLVSVMPHVGSLASVSVPEEGTVSPAGEARSQGRWFALEPLTQLSQPAEVEWSLAFAVPLASDALSVLGEGGEGIVARFHPSGQELLSTTAYDHPSAPMGSVSDSLLFSEPEGVAVLEQAVRRVELLLEPPPDAGDAPLTLGGASQALGNIPLEGARRVGEGIASGGSRRELSLNLLAEDSAPRRRVSSDHVPLSAPLFAGQTQSSRSISIQEAAPVPVSGEIRWQLAEQLSQQIEQMVYQREQNALTMHLNPPELGVIEIRVQATGTEVQAWVSAEQESTRQMLAQAQQHLREQLEARGLQLTHFDVGGQRSFAFARPFRTPPSPSWQTALHTPAATESLVYEGRWSVWV